jgi:hypothetical protein
VDRTAAFKAAEDNLAALLLDAMVKALCAEADAVISKIASADAARDAANLDLCCKLSAIFSLLNCKMDGTTTIAVQGLDKVFDSNPFILASLGTSAEVALSNLLDYAVVEEVVVTTRPNAEVNEEEEESGTPLEEDPSPSPPLKEEMQCITPSRVIEREAFILALMPLARAAQFPTSSSAASTPPSPSLPAWPASREYEERLGAYHASRKTLPSPVDMAPVFHAEVNLAEILETVCGTDPKPRSFWLATLKDLPLLSSRLGVPDILCLKTQEEFNALFASFAPSREDAAPNDEGNPPPENVASIEELLSFFSTSWVAPSLDGDVPAVASE